MKAVHKATPSIEVVDVDEPDGEGNLYGWSRRGSGPQDLTYLRWGCAQIAGHECAGVLEDGSIMEPIPRTPTACRD